LISGIILASGHALRMGKQQKLLLNIGNKPMVERVIETVKASRINEIILVYQDPRIKSIGKSNGLTTVYNPNSKDGQSTSIRAGIRAARSDSKGFMFFVGDQPFLQVDIINRLLEVFEEENYSIVQPVYDEQRGNPVLFHKKFRKDLLNIKGDTGGRSIIGENMEDVCFVKFDNPIFGKDIDTWEVYEEFRDRG